MDVQAIKNQLAKTGDDTRSLSNSLISLGLAMRHIDRATIFDLLSPSPDPGIDEIIQRLRVDLAALDRAVALVGEELRARARYLEPSADQPPAKPPLN